MSPEAQNALKALEYASYLAIDQYNGNGTTELTFLRSTYHVPGLPTNIDAIDFRGNEYHRKFTHYGWDHQYYDDKANWAVRKNILLATTEKVFDFQTFSGKMLWHDFGYAQKCNSFAALVYYVHVLGDHDARESYKNIAMMQLAQPHPDQSPDIYSELKYHLQILFADQASTHKYKAFMEELDTQAEEARRLAASTGGINTDEKFAVYKGQVEALLTLAGCEASIPYDTLIKCCGKSDLYFNTMQLFPVPDVSRWHGITVTSPFSLPEAGLQKTGSKP